MPKVARVLIDNSPDLELDYSIPDGLTGSVVEGSRVAVPLRAKRTSGTVLELLDAPPLGKNGKPVPLKPLSTLLGGRPFFSASLIALGRWIAGYYCTSLDATLRSMVPEAVRSEKQSFKTRKRAVLTKLPDAAEREHLSRRAPRQAAILKELAESAEGIAITEFSGASAALKALQEKGFVSVEDKVVTRDPFEDETFLASRPLNLNGAQQVALKAVTAAVESRGSAKPLLLYGITGSGKTEVYLQAVDNVLERGQSALVLVPEISLTPQTVDRFKSRFSHIQDSVAVLHSHLSAGERHDEWHKIHRREARIVVGARSAIFAPLEQLGLIIVDEEHEFSYKQENPPRYNARDIAVVRAGIERCAVLLGSATPSFESFQNTRAGKYDIVTLDERADDRTLPIVRVVDLRTESRKTRGKSPGPSVLSERLRIAMDRRLDRGEQTILFINRRGFASSLVCQTCGHVCECQHCSIPLTFHKKDDRLVCHICGFRQLAPQKCPAPDCRDPGIRFAGFGTERVEEQLRAAMPAARTARVDTDTMSRKNQLRDTLAAFRSQKIDILVGTQMIAKGLDFPNVTLVGVLNADLGLHIPDFRAGERTFQLLTQVAGRAGRGEMKGEVVIQTFTPHSPAIQFARHHDYTGYSEQELEFRQGFSYPPFSHVVLLTSRSTHERRAEFTLETLAKRLKKTLPDDVIMGDPSPSPLARAQDQFRFQLMLRARRTATITRPLQATLEATTIPGDVIVTTDIDPLNLM